MKTITVAFWRDRYTDLPYTQNQTFENTIENRNSIIDECLNKGYSTMIRPCTEGILIWIDKHRFGQS